ncbi:hypothetical protein ABWI00_06010 [Algihabitans albus]|uniref:hypothetical protein n=1 Tax=Algihabitans albus TaxID=2164067 RepID=UPI0035CEA04D
MFNWFKDRLKEPTTYAGLGMAIYGVGQAFDIREAPAVAEAVGQGGAIVGGGGDLITAGVVTLGGVLAAILGERGQRR